RPGGPRLSWRVRACPAPPMRGRLPAAAADSFLVPQDGFEPFADVRNADVDDGVIVTVAAALGAIIDPHRRHPELLRRPEVADHVFNHHRTVGLNAELIKQLS